MGNPVIKSWNGLHLFLPELRRRCHPVVSALPAIDDPSPLIHRGIGFNCGEHSRLKRSGVHKWRFRKAWQGYPRCNLPLSAILRGEYEELAVNAANAYRPAVRSEKCNAHSVGA